MRILISRILDAVAAFRLKSYYKKQEINH